MDDGSIQIWIDTQPIPCQAWRSNATYRYRLAAIA